MKCSGQFEQEFAIDLIPRTPGYHTKKAEVERGKNGMNRRNYRKSRGKCSDRSMILLDLYGICVKLEKGGGISYLKRGLGYESS